MSHWMECGTLLIEKPLEHEGMIPFCPALASPGSEHPEKRKKHPPRTGAAFLRGGCFMRRGPRSGPRPPVYCFVNTGCPLTEMSPSIGISR